MISFFQRSFLLSLILSSVACQRAAEEKSTLIISLPPSEKVGSLSCSTCLKFMAVNISGEGISSTIYAKKEHGDFSELGTEISPEIEIEVPVGKQRLFQVVAAYSDADDKIEVKYGTATADLSGSTNQVALTLSSLGNFEGGHIAGRYLTGSNIGPTGVVNINLIPAPGLRAFTLFKTNIINGWFEFFASKNFDVSYEMENGMPLLSNIKLNEDFLPANLAGNWQIARIARPAQYDRYDGSAWVTETEDDTELIIGYFFAPGVSDNNKKICKQSTTLDLTNLSPSGDGGVNLLVYDPLGTTGEVRVYGGATSTDHADCGSVYTQKYNQNVITLDGEQFNGMGNDTAKSLQGAFSYFMLSGEIKKFERTSNTYSFKFLPNVYNNIYDGAKLYRAGTEPSDSDNLMCNLNSLSANGFAEVPLSGSSATGNVLSMTTVATVSSGYGIVCPSKSGELRGDGGMYLGSIASAGSPAILTISDGPIYNYGTVATGASVTHTFTIVNSGGSNATGIGGTGLATPFQFTGGTYPGTGGNCGAVLAPSASCTITVAYSPVAVSTVNDTIIIGYNDGVLGQTATRDLEGVGANPALLAITGAPDFGATPVGTPDYRMFTVTNTGGVTATSVSGNMMTAPFSFAGGGAYPGTGGGTCGATLAPAATCLIRIEYLPSAYVPSNQNIQIPYNDGVTGQTAILNILGTGT